MHILPYYPYLYMLFILHLNQLFYTGVLFQSVSNEPLWYLFVISCLYKLLLEYYLEVFILAVFIVSVYLPWFLHFSVC